ncbi:hypothetical protein GALMADRAFT_279912 [Galerina marginata CBS 339.88]|uniref:Uncharacterized protein n=1 Tax=Galerina marginata (strain CBS 339.88) TaxID=685588 RepID=A0A067SYH0_GALM3|nr:hypothetical protein GALMADRAFT_279912 [Galerina marginata CBS 339.88]
MFTCTTQLAKFLASMNTTTGDHTSSMTASQLLARSVREAEDLARSVVAFWQLRRPGDGCHWTSADVDERRRFRHRKSDVNREEAGLRKAAVTSFVVGSTILEALVTMWVLKGICISRHYEFFGPERVGRRNIDRRHGSGEGLSVVAENPGNAAKLGLLTRIAD